MNDWWFKTWPSSRSTRVPQITNLCLWATGKTYFLHISLKCPYHQNFLFSHPILHFMHWTSAKKFFDLDKKRFCYECLKTWKSYFLAVDPCHWSQHRHAQSCDVVRERATLGLTYLACFTSVNLASWSMQNAPFQHVVWTITEVKQAR